MDGDIDPFIRRASSRRVRRRRRRKRVMSDDSSVRLRATVEPGRDAEGSEQKQG